MVHFLKCRNIFKLQWNSHFFIFTPFIHNTSSKTSKCLFCSPIYLLYTLYIMPGFSLPNPSYTISLLILSPCLVFYFLLKEEKVIKQVKLFFWGKDGKETQWVKPKLNFFKFLYLKFMMTFYDECLKILR